MHEYGVAEPGWKALPWTWAAERLDSGRSYWLATASAEARPHAMPVWGVWDDGEHRFAFSCAPGARKARNLAANPRCVVTTDDTEEFVSIEGRAELVADVGRLERWIERYLTKYRPAAPDLDPEFLRRNALYEITPERAFGIIEREDDFAKRATRWRF
jgi:PPOX class probable F420-dependent enzyme